MNETIKVVLTAVMALSAICTFTYYQGISMNETITWKMTPDEHATVILALEIAAKESNRPKATFVSHGFENLLNKIGIEIGINPKSSNDN